MSAAAQAKVDDSRAPLESREYNRQDKRQRIRQILAKPPSQEELRQYIERVRKVIYQHDGTPEKVLIEVSSLPDVFYRILDYLSHGNFSDAQKTMQTYVVSVSTELSRFVNNPEYAEQFYEILYDGLGALATAEDPRAKGLAVIARPYLKRLIEKESARIKMKKAGKRKLREKQKELEELVGE